MIKLQLNQVLGVVLKIFYRLCRASETEEDHFPVEYYRDMVYENNLFDMAKLYDIVAIYGQSNPETVKTIVNNVFENDRRYVQQFGESVGMMITMLKKVFSTSVKVSELISGQSFFVERTRSEQDDIIKRLLIGLIEIMSNVELTTTYFPDSMLETVRNTSLPLFMANVYCLMIGPVKTQWLKDSTIQPELEAIRK